MNERKHCKGCTHLHRVSMNWCCKYGKPSRVVIGHCKLNNGKELHVKPVPLTYHDVIK